VTTYEALKRLSKKGLVKIRAKQNTRIKYFEVEEIASLENALAKQRENIESALDNLQSIIPELRSLQKGGSDRPVVLFYEGPEGIKNVLLDTLAQKPQEIISFASADFLHVGYDAAFLEKYWAKRTQMKIPSRGIMPGTARAKSFFTEEKNRSQLRRIKFIPPELYDFENEIDIYGDNISITSLAKDNEYGVIIRSRNIAKGLRSLFELLWAMEMRNSF
jgi:sugar-specific transcriptional regulator TrmB